MYAPHQHSPLTATTTTYNSQPPYAGSPLQQPISYIPPSTTQPSYAHSPNMHLAPRQAPPSGFALSPPLGSTVQGNAPSPSLPPHSAPLPGADSSSHPGADTSPTVGAKPGAGRRMYPVEDIEGAGPAMANMSLNDRRGSGPSAAGPYPGSAPMPGYNPAAAPAGPDSTYQSHPPGTGAGYAPPYAQPQPGSPYPQHPVAPAPAPAPGYNPAQYQQGGTVPAAGGYGYGGQPNGPYGGAPSPHQQHQQPGGSYGAYPPGGAAGSDVSAMPTAANMCPPRYARMTVNAVPATQALLTKSSIPLGLVLHPLAQPEHEGEHIPVVNFGSCGIVRCRRCRTYVNPFAPFIEGGKRWRCNICDLANEVPPEYYCQLDPATGLRTDVASRPELARGVVEFVAPSEYMVRPPQPAVYFFVIDVTYNAIATGMLSAAIEGIKQTLSKLPGGSRTQVGIITFDKTVHFYSLKSTQSRPQMLVVPDIENVFVPLPDDLLVNLRESRHLIDDLLEKIPNMFARTQQVESAFGPTLKAAFNVIRHIGGKMIIFQSAVPKAGVGAIVDRDDPKLLNTDKEAVLLNPSDPAGTYYKDFALDCSRQQISIDLFLFPSTSFMDVATLGTLPQITGGELFYYPNFNPKSQDNERFIRDLAHDLTRETGFEAVMRVRCGRGLKVLAHHGNFFIRSTDLLVLPNVDADKSFTIQLGLSESISGVRYTSIQSALLYTTSNGERRIRVFTSCLPVTSTLGDMFKHADCLAIASLTGKMAIDKGLSSKLSDAREAMVNKTVEILAVYRESFGSNSAGSQLVLPESLRLLPLYVLAMIKNVLFRSGTDTKPDERAFHMYRFKTLPVEECIAFVYPNLYALNNMPPNIGQRGEDGRIVFPPAISLSSEKLQRSGIFVLDTAFGIFVYIARDTAPNTIQQLFGVSAQELAGSTGPVAIFDGGDDEYARGAYALISGLQTDRWHKYLPVYAIIEGTPLDAVFFSYFVEDRSRNVYSYYEFLCQLQRSVSAKVK
eukprot:TRINITY_DN1458_c0_g2_i2.p1 TRINITY_DN1458_c0_g2~~TRINITY_DN1458_c0_g2_i2.p1  ORF type:complete len:1117 (-),score=203.17 TRINITY_DN1458_c0_g2_i2:19-3039(-)